MKNQFLFPKLIISKLTATALVVSSSIAFAEDHKQETHDAHEHGRAKLMLVAEKQQLSMQFESPAMNIVGFEHKAKTEEQHTLVKNAVKTLAKPEDLFVISGGQCIFNKVHVDNPFPLDEEHAHKEHQDHGHEDHAYESEHREFLVEYSAKCQASDKIEQIDVKLLNTFSGIEELDIQYIHANKQGADSLNANRTILRFK